MLETNPEKPLVSKYSKLLNPKPYCGLNSKTSSLKPENPKP